ncbi:Sec-independent protein translocase subunit TatA [Nocardia sp. NPDC003482]|uniref:Sec-independent protein translocase subunit TatA n=1 Tax=Nocardia sp. NPDC004068 TaxID=3364303 RepID=UPI0036CD2108
MGSFGPTHWLIIALLFLLLFGAKRLPDAARGLGRSLRIFKSEMNEMHNDGSQSGTPAAQTPAPAQQELPPAQPNAAAPQAKPETHKA